LGKIWITVAQLIALIQEANRQNEVILRELIKTPSNTGGCVGGRSTKAGTYQYGVAGG
jgi:hypothetical protein